MIGPMWKLAWVMAGCVLVLAGPVSVQAAPKVAVGDQAPDFSLRDSEGSLVRLSDIAFPGKEKSWKKKKKVLIDFFRTDCAPCVKELPQVIAYHEKHKDEVRILMVALLETENGEEKLDLFLKAHKVPFTVVVDSYETAAKKYIVDDDSLTLPSIFLLSKDGKVLARLVGLEENLEHALQKAQEAQKTGK